MFTLGRKIDVSYKSNRLIALSVVLLTGIGWWVTGEIVSGLILGGTVFLTWALSRELDPPHDYSAFVAAALSLFVLADIESIQFLTPFWLLLLLRTVNGITGKELTLLDVIFMLSLTVYVSFTNENPIYLLLFVLAMFFNRQRGTKNVLFLIAGVFGFILFLAQIFTLHPLTLNSLESLSTLNFILLIVAILTPVLGWFLSQDEMEDDQGNQANRTKVFASQILYGISLLLFVFFTEISFGNQVIYLAVVVGVALYYLALRVLTIR